MTKSAGPCSALYLIYIDSWEADSVQLQCIIVLFRGTTLPPSERLWVPTVNTWQKPALETQQHSGNSTSDFFFVNLCHALSTSSICIDCLKTEQSIRVTWINRMWKLLVAIKTWLSLCDGEFMLTALLYIPRSYSATIVSLAGLAGPRAGSFLQRFSLQTRGPEDWLCSQICPIQQDDAQSCGEGGHRLMMIDETAWNYHMSC